MPKRLSSEEAWWILEADLQEAGGERGDGWVGSVCCCC